jgi:hypothetical protein
MKKLIIKDKDKLFYNGHMIRIDKLLILSNKMMGNNSFSWDQSVFE